MSFLGAGPPAVLSAAGRARTAAGALLALPGRVLGLVDRIEAAVGRVEVLLDAVAATAARADEVAAASALVASEADRVARLSGGVAVEARGVVAAAAESESAVATLVGAYAPTLEVLRPTLTRLAETMDPREVEAMVGLVDRLPPLLDSVDRDVLPLLGRLNEMAPDLHSLLEAVEDLRRTVAGLPGFGMLRRRGDVELQDDDDDRPPQPLGGDLTRGGATRARG